MTTRAKPAIVLPCEPVHTNEHPFCDDMLCPCHNDDSAEGIAYRREYVIEPLEAGLMTPNEAADLFTGRQF